MGDMKGICLLHMGPSSAMQADRHLFGVYHSVRNMSLPTSKRKAANLRGQLKDLAGWGPATPDFFTLQPVDQDMQKPFVMLGAPAPRTRRERKQRSRSVVAAAHRQMRARFTKGHEEQAKTAKEREVWNNKQAAARKAIASATTEEERAVCVDHLARVRRDIDEWSKARIEHARASGEAKDSAILMTLTSDPRASRHHAKVAHEDAPQDASETDTGTGASDTNASEADASEVDASDDDASDGKGEGDDDETSDDDDEVEDEASDDKEEVGGDAADDDSDAVASKLLRVTEDLRVTLAMPPEDDTLPQLAVVQMEIIENSRGGGDVCLWFYGVASTREQAAAVVDALSRRNVWDMKDPQIFALHIGIPTTPQDIALQAQNVPKHFTDDRTRILAMLSGMMPRDEDEIDRARRAGLLAKIMDECPMVPQPAGNGFEAPEGAI